MLINNVKLRNFKAYGNDFCSIDFKTGVNLIHGNNGSGKTTILEAIAFALFGDNVFEHKQKESVSLIREGQNEAEVRLTFTINSFNGETCRFRIERVIKKREMKVKVYDAITGNDITDRIPDVNQWILGCLDVSGLGVDELGSDGTDGDKTDNYIKYLYQAVVCVSQGEMTTLFNDKNKSLRNKTFATLLKADELLLTKKKLGDVKRELDKKISVKEHEIELIAKDVENLRDAESNLSRLSADLQANEQKTTEVKRLLSELIEEQKELVTIHDQISLIVGEINELDIRIQAGETSLKVSQDSLRIAEEAEGVVARSKTGYQAYQAAISKQQELSTRQAERDALNRHLGGLKNEMTAVQTRLSKTAEQLMGISLAQARMAELQPMAETQKHLEAEINTLRLEVAAITEIEKGLKEREARLADRKISRDMASEESETRTRLEKEYKEGQALFEQIKQDIETIAEQLLILRKDEEAAKEVIGGLKQQQRTLSFYKEQLEKEEKAQNIAVEILRRSEDEISQRKITESTIDHLEREKKKLNSDEVRASSRLESIEREISDAEKHMEMLGEAHQSCPVCCKPLSDEEAAKLKIKTRETIDNFQAENAQLASRLNEIFAHYTEIEGELIEARGKLTVLAMEADVTRLSHEIAERNATILSWKEKISELSSLTGNLAGAEAELAGIQKRIQGAEQEKGMKETDNRIREAAQHNLLERIYILATPENVAQINQEISLIHRDIETEENRLDKLRAKSTQIKPKQDELDGLGNPLRELDLLSHQINSLDALEAENKELASQQDSIQSRMDEDAGKLLPFDGLDEAIQEARRILEQNQCDSTLYLTNQSVADSAEALRKKVLEESEALKALIETRAERQQTYDQQKNLYNTERHAVLAGLINEQNAVISSLKTEREFLTIQTTENSDRFAQFTAFMDKQRNAEAEHEQLKKQMDVLSFLIKSIDDAYPRILEKRRNVISQQAREYLRRILRNDYIHLEITDDYTVQVRFNQDSSSLGSIRYFRQLSGGEQMAVSLAVRMAILSCMSNLRIIFLDEPTANLDNTRKEGLASSISELETMNALQQIFVITHDDTFTHVNPHKIKVTKNKDVSEIEY